MGTKVIKPITIVKKFNIYVWALKISKLDAFWDQIFNLF